MVRMIMILMLVINGLHAMQTVNKEPSEMDILAEQIKLIMLKDKMFSTDFTASVNPVSVVNDKAVDQDDQDYIVAAYGMGSRTYIREGDSITVKVGGSAAWRSNNGPNMTCMSGIHSGAIGIAHSNYGDKGDSKKCIFLNEEAGKKALSKLLVRRYNKYSLRYELKKYQTSKVGYKLKLRLLKHVGVDVGRRYSTLSANQKKLVVKQILISEGYKKGNVYKLSYSKLKQQNPSIANKLKS